MTANRRAELTAIRNRLNSLGDAILGRYFDFATGEHTDTAFLFPQGSAKNAKRIRIRNRINARLRA